MIKTVGVFEKWSGREDSNLRPPRPERGALPGCATSRQIRARYSAHDPKGQEPLPI